MLYSLYPTDATSVRDAVAEAAAAQPAEPVFTSLHIPEARDLDAYCSFLGEAHRERGLTWWADISPRTLEQLHLDLDRIGDLGRLGVVGLRLDFGFSTPELRRIAASGLPIAVNASTISQDELDTLADVGVVGWHNFYPRPDTGLDPTYFRQQSDMFARRGLPVYAFVPGEVTRRAPLHRGLPTLETHRDANAWSSAVALRALVPNIRIVCAEGVLRPEHQEWMTLWERDGVLTIPLAEVARGSEFLLDDVWPLRPEQTGRTQRLEASRGIRPGLESLAASPSRLAGGIYVDGPDRARYEGEVHLVVRELASDPTQHRIAQVAAAYVDVLAALTGRERVRFVRV